MLVKKNERWLSKVRKGTVSKAQTKVNKNGVDIMLTKNIGGEFISEMKCHSLYIFWSTKHKCLPHTYNH